MPREQSEGTSLRLQPRLWDSYPAKSPNLRHHQARSQNKGLSRASQLWTGPSPTGDRQVRTARAGRGHSAPDRHAIPNGKQTSLLTKTSWDSGLSTSARRVEPEISSPEETHGTPEKAPRLYTHQTEQQGRRR